MNLKKMRLENQKSVFDVAQALGVTINAIYNYESGIRCINIEQVLILSQLYEISAEEVIQAQLNSCRCAQSDNPQ